jgi:7TM diverse intracellular signalling/7TMR-DISM extracellular 2
VQYFKFWLCSLLMLCGLSPAALALPAWTELQSVLEAQSKAIPVSTLVDEDAQLPLQTLGNVPGKITIEQVAQMSLVNLKPFNPHITHPMQADQALWLHFRLTADHPDMATGWLLEFNRPFVDRVELHSQNSQGTWKMQAAGDLMAHAQWPRRSLNPQFSIPTLTPGAHDFYIRVANSTPLHFGVNLQRTDVMHTQNQHQFLWLGLLLGFMALMSIASLLMALAYRNAIYLWYTLYVGLGFLACAAYVGIASYAFWRHALWWPEVSSNVLLMAAVTVQTQFCRALFYSSTTEVWRQRAITAVCIASLLSIGLMMLTNHVNLRLQLINLVFLLNTAAMLSMVVRAVRQGSLTGKLWLLAYIPLICVVLLTLVDAQGWIPLPWLSFNAPVYALLFEMPVLLVALHQHAKAQHARAVRETTLADLDPLTGFVAAEHFPRLLAQHWGQAQIDQTDLTVAYVHPMIDPAFADLGGEPPNEQQAILRTVRLLRTVALPKDHVACVQAGVYALIMPQGKVKGEVAQRLSRLIALGMMQQDQIQHHLPMRFRIAVSSTSGYSGMWHELDTELRSKIALDKGWDKRNIRYVNKRMERDWDSADLSDFWDKALDAEAIPKDAAHSSNIVPTTVPSRLG